MLTIVRRLGGNGRSVFLELLEKGEELSLNDGRRNESEGF